MAVLDLGDDFRSRMNECMSPEGIARSIDAILKALEYIRSISSR